MTSFKLAVVLLFCAFSAEAQTDATRAFENSKGCLQYPLTNIVSVESGNQIYRQTSIISTPPHISFVSDNNSTVKTVYDGKVVASQSVDGMYMVITQCGDYFITYSGLNKPLVQKGDVVTAGQPLSSLTKDLDDKYRLTMYIVDEKKYHDPNLWFANTAQMVYKSKVTTGKKVVLP